MKYDTNKILEICSHTKSMAEAARQLGMNYKTLKKHTESLGIFKPNPSGKGMKKKDNGTKIPLNEILEGLHPSYQTNKLRIRLIKEDVKSEKCEVCGIDEWLGQKISLELDHIDGDKHNHKYDNLRIVCPNCHSQTSTYRGKNIGANRQKW
jgi:Zn finger protein HypA/HybF involved in hydrogenase expression